MSLYEPTQATPERIQARLGARTPFPALTPWTIRTVRKANHEYQQIEVGVSPVGLLALERLLVEWTPWAVVAISAALIPGGVALVRMRRDTDNHLTRIQSLETKTDRQERDIDSVGTLAQDLKVTVAAGFARIEALLTHRREDGRREDERSR